MTKHALLHAALLINTVILFGCNGDEVIGTGVDKEIIGLKLPVSIDVIAPKEEKATSSSMQLNEITQAVFSDAGTDYSNDTTGIFSGNELQSTIEGANDLLCFLNALRLDLMVNKGPYKVILTKDPCSDENELNTELFLASFTVVSERNDNQSPQRFKVWESYLTDSEYFKNATFPPEVLFEGNINANVSASVPFGDFSISYKHLHLLS